MKLSDSKHKLTCFVIMTLFPFYKNMLHFSGWSCSYKRGALLAKFQPGVLNPFVLICGCLLYFLTWFQLAYLTNYLQVSFQGSESKHILLWGNNLWEWLRVDLENAAYLWKNSAYAMPTETRLIQDRPFPENSSSYPSEALCIALQTRWLG